MALSQSHARMTKALPWQVRPNYHIDEFSTGADPAAGPQPEAADATDAEDPMPQGNAMRSKKRQPAKDGPRAWAPSERRRASGPIPRALHPAIPRGCRRGAAHASHRDRRLAAYLTHPAGVAAPRRRHGEGRSAGRCHCHLSQILPRGGRNLGRGICTRPWREPSLDQWLNQTPGMVGRAASARAGIAPANAAGNVLCVTGMGAPRITGKVVRHGNR